MPDEDVVSQQVGGDATPRVGFEFEVDECGRRPGQAEHLVGLRGDGQVGVEHLGRAGGQPDARGQERHPVRRPGVDQAVQRRVEGLRHTRFPAARGVKSGANRHREQRHCTRAARTATDPNATIKPDQLAVVKIHAKWRSSAWWVGKTLANALDIGFY